MKKLINSLSALPFFILGFPITIFGLIMYYGATYNGSGEVLSIVLISIGAVLLSFSIILFVGQNSHLTYVRWLLLTLGIFIFVIGGGYVFYVLNPGSYHNWSVEKKQMYQFTLLERKLLSSPEKLSKISAVVQEKEQGNCDTITPATVKKLTSYPCSYTEITVPFSEYGSNYSLTVTHYKDGQTTAFINYKEYEFRMGYSQNLYEKTGTGDYEYLALVSKQSYPYAQGKHEGYFIFKEVSDVEFEKLTLEALKKVNEIVKNI